MINRTRPMPPQQQPRPLPTERKTLRQLREPKAPKAPPFEVPKICPGGTVVCCASGPSLVKEDVEYAHAKGATIIAVNDAYVFAPFAAALMASDAAWWIHKKPDFRGLRFSLDPNASRAQDVITLRKTGEQGIEINPTGLRSGRNSGSAAINLAVHFGAARILLLGYDMGCRDERHSHFFGGHKFPLRGNSPYKLFRDMMANMVGPLQQLGVEVLNCSRHTELKCFPRRPLEEALP